MKNVLVLAPHPDDEVLGCGGTIAAPGLNVFVLFGSIGSVSQYTGEDDNVKQRTRNLEITEREITAAATILGFQWAALYTTWKIAASLDSFTQRDLMDQILARTTELLAPTMQMSDLDTVFLPSPASHQDHRAMYRAGLAIAHVMCLRYGVHAFYCYDSGYWGWDPQEEIHPSLFISLSREQVEKKLAAMKAYESQVGRAKVFEPTFVVEGCRRAGALVGKDYAETFSVLRKVI